MHAPGQAFERVGGQDRYRFLHEDWTRVELASDEVHGGSRPIDARAKGLLDGIHPAAKFGQQRWVDVDDPAGEGLQEGFGVHAVVTRINDQLDAVRPEEVAHG